MRFFRFRPALLALTLAGALGGCTGGGDSSSSGSSGPPPQVVTMDEGLPDPVARVGGKDIKLADLEAEAASAVVQAQMRLYEARKQALDKMIDDQLMEEAAKEKGVAKEELVKQEVDSKIPKVDDAAIQKFYDENKDKMRQPLEQMKDRITRHLERQGRSEAEANFKKALREKAKVEVFLSAPRIQVSVDDDPSMGSKDAPVTIVEFSDFQCPYCSKAAATVHEVAKKYGDKVQIVFRDFPLPMHNRAGRAAEAAQCANDQQKFWEYHDELFKNSQKMSDDDLVAHAQTVGLKTETFKECLMKDTHKDEVAKDVADGKRAGMSGTPGFFINGRFMSGARPIEAFSEIIDEELAAKGGKAM